MNNTRCLVVRSWLLTDVLRGEWNRTDAYITTDCGVMRNNMGPPLNLKTPEESCAATINAGTVGWPGQAAILIVISSRFFSRRKCMLQFLRTLKWAPQSGIALWCQRLRKAL
jgi:hypothetical protein